MLVFEDRGKPEYLEKISQSKVENQQQTQHPHMALTPGFEPGPHCWEASALTTDCAILAPPPPPPEQEKGQEMMSGISVFN